MTMKCKEHSLLLCHNLDCSKPNTDHSWRCAGSIIVLNSSCTCAHIKSYRISVAAKHQQTGRRNEWKINKRDSEQSPVYACGSIAFRNLDRMTWEYRIIFELSYSIIIGKLSQHLIVVSTFTLVLKDPAAQRLMTTSAMKTAGLPAP